MRHTLRYAIRRTVGVRTVRCSGGIVAITTELVAHSPEWNLLVERSILTLHPEWHILGYIRIVPREGVVTCVPPGAAVADLEAEVILCLLDCRAHPTPHMVRGLGRAALVNILRSAGEAFFLTGTDLDLTEQILNLLSSEE